MQLEYSLLYTFTSMQNNIQTAYQENIKNRTKIRYLKGLVPRFINHLRNSYIIWIARRRGAKIGDYVTISYKLAQKANANLTIGDHSSIQTDLLDLRAAIKIGNHVIIGENVEIITASHDVDSSDWSYKPYGITIEDYVWLATKAFILPSCQQIAYGAICAAGSVVAHNIEAMEIIVGNPGKPVRIRKRVHTNLCVESLLGNDFRSYIRARANK